ncbi:MAG: AsmA-like C-terminal domain-containing protein [Alphaproteobacteria bacterium]|nr:AsmA-like C-terminal domain-containing protein [Alphaproteobacteria bacterium]
MRFISRLVHVVRWVLLLCVLAAGLLAWRLSRGPVDLDFALPYVVRALSPANTNHVARASSVQLRGGSWTTPLLLLVQDLDIETQEGDSVVQIKSIAVDFSLLSLVRGRLVPRTLILEKPSFHLVKEKDSLKLDSRGITGGGKGAANVVLYFLSPGNLRQLRQLEINDGELIFDDKSLGHSIVVPSFNVQLVRSGTQWTLSAKTDITQPKRLSLAFTGRIRYNPADNLLETTINLPTINPSALGFEVFIPVLSAIDLPVGGSFTIKRDIMDNDLRRGLVGFSFRLFVKKGQVVLPQMPGNKFMLDSLTLAGEYRRDDDRLKIESFDAAWKNTTAKFDFDITGGRRIIEENNFSDLKVVLNASGRNLLMHNLPYYWPSVIGPHVYEWVRDGITTGLITGGEFEIILSGRDAPGSINVDSINGQARVMGATVRYLEGLPPVIGMDGTAHITLDRIDIDILSGESNGLNIEKARVSFTDLQSTTKPVTMSVDLNASGSIGDAVSILSLPPFELTQDLGLEDGQVSGTGKAHIKLSLPLVDNLTFDMVNTDVQASAVDARLSDIFAGRDLTAQALDLSLDNRGMRIQGETLFGKIPIKAVFRQNFRTGGKVFSLDFLPMSKADDWFYIRNNAPYNVTVSLDKKGYGTIKGDGNITASQLDIAFLGYSKPAGSQARMTVDGAFGKGRITRLDVKVDGEYRLDLALDKAVVKTAATDAEFRYDFLQKPPRIDVIAQRFYAGPLMEILPDIIKDGGGRRDGGFIMPILDAAIGTVMFGTGGHMTALVMKTGSDGNIWATAQLPNRGGRVSVDYHNDRLEVKIPDFGSFLEIVHSNDKIRSGNFALSASRKADRWSGGITMRDFYLIRAPTAAKIISMAGLTSILDILHGQGIRFDKLTTEFSLEDGVFSIKDALMRGSSLGISADGTFNMKTDWLDMRGTVLPMYFLNSLLGRIPLIGGLFRWESGDALIGVNYRVDGNFNNPNISVNPLSVITPGFLRR